MGKDQLNPLLFGQQVFSYSRILLAYGIDFISVLVPVPVLFSAVYCPSDILLLLPVEA